MLTVAKRGWIITAHGRNASFPDEQLRRRVLFCAKLGSKGPTAAGWYLGEHEHMWLSQTH